MAFPTYDNSLLQMNRHVHLKVAVLSYQQRFVFMEQQIRLWCGVRGRIHCQASPS